MSNERNKIALIKKNNIREFEINKEIKILGDIECRHNFSIKDQENSTR